MSPTGHIGQFCSICIITFTSLRYCCSSHPSPATRKFPIYAKFFLFHVQPIFSRSFASHSPRRPPSATYASDFCVTKRICCCWTIRNAMRVVFGRRCRQRIVPLVLPLPLSLPRLQKRTDERVVLLLMFCPLPYYMFMCSAL